MRDYEFCDFWGFPRTWERGLWLLLLYYMYQQPLLWTFYLWEVPFDRENAKSLKDLNIIVMLKFYVESTDKHPESDFGLFWNFWKPPVTKSFSSLNFLQANFHFFYFEIKMKQKIRMIFFHAPCQRWKNI